MNAEQSCESPMPMIFGCDKVFILSSHWSAVLAGRNRLYLNHDIALLSPTFTKGDDGAVHGAFVSWPDHAFQQTSTASLFIVSNS